MNGVNSSGRWWLQRLSEEADGGWWSLMMRRLLPVPALDGWSLDGVCLMCHGCQRWRQGRKEGHTFILHLWHFKLTTTPTTSPSHCCFPLQPLKSTDRGKKDVKFKSVSNPWTTASRSPHGWNLSDMRIKIRINCSHCRLIFSKAMD